MTETLSESRKKSNRFSREICVYKPACRSLVAKRNLLDDEQTIN
jgi:hypothetical protein